MPPSSRPSSSVPPSLSFSLPHLIAPYCALLCPPSLPRPCPLTLVLQRRSSSSPAWQLRTGRRYCQLLPDGGGADAEPHGCAPEERPELRPRRSREAIVCRRMVCSTALPCVGLREHWCRCLYCTRYALCGSLSLSCLTCGAQWERLEGAWEEGLRQSKRKQREGPKTLLRQAQAALTDGHGPIFSDALRLIDRLVICYLLPPFPLVAQRMEY